VRGVWSWRRKKEPNPPRAPGAAKHRPRLGGIGETRREAFDLSPRSLHHLLQVGEKRNVHRIVGRAEGIESGRRCRVHDAEHAEVLLRVLVDAGEIARDATNETTRARVVADGASPFVSESRLELAAAA
jgi:hypothetical protein